MRALLLSLSRLSRRLLPSITALRAPPPLLRHLHADHPPPPPPHTPPFSSRILESNPGPGPGPGPGPDPDPGPALAPSPPSSDPVLDEFLSRFVASLRPRLAAAFPSLARPILDEMLRLVCQAVVSRLAGAEAAEVPVELSDDLWATVWEISATVRDAMLRDQVRADLRQYLHCDEVKEMTRFAFDVGVRGNMLRELRFKWAREKLEEVKFYRGLDTMRAQAEASDNPTPALPQELTALPQRKGEVKFKIHGLDLSDPTWAEVAERAAEAERHFVPEEARPVDGKAKMAEERLLAVHPKKGDPAPAMAEWKEEHRPKRVDWLALLERVKTRSVELYLKVAEILLAEESFEANIQDYSKLIDLHSKANHVEDAERILRKMKEKGIAPDILTSIILVHMYSKAGNLEQAKEAFDHLRKEGFQPDLKLYSSMINAYIKSGDPNQAEQLRKQMDSLDIKATKEIYMELLRAFAECGKVDKAQSIMTSMQFAGIQPTLESFTLLLEACGRLGHADLARNHFDQMRCKHKPDDRCVASMMSAYMKSNQLDEALDLLLDLEKEGFERGVKTNLVLVDWLGMLQLVQEAEQLVQKIRKAGEEPFELHVILVDMYAKARQEEKARKSLKILEDKKHLLKADQFERIIRGLREGGFSEDASRFYKMMKTRGFAPSEQFEVWVNSGLNVKVGVRHSSRHRG